MFGDLGHGSLVFFSASIMCLFYNQLKGGLLDDILPYRYFFLLLGFMSSYAGLVYNEFFALPINMFESCYGIDSKQMWNAAMNEDG